MIADKLEAIETREREGEREIELQGYSMENKKKSGGVSFFQMPLHYPRYTKKDYEDMPEWMLDRLLAEYGLSAHGDLPSKRQFAMGAFLWPADFVGASRRDPNKSSNDHDRNFKDDSLLKKEV